jgi:hypothetical protein
MSGDFDFFTNDEKNKAKSKAPARSEPKGREPDERDKRVPEAHAADDGCEFDDDLDSPARPERKRRRDDRDDRDDRRSEPRDRAPSGEKKRGMSPLIIGGIALGALIVVGGGVAVVIAARGRDPERNEKQGTTSFATSTPRPAPTLPAKKDAFDPNSPSAEVVDKVKKATVRVLVAYKNGKGATGSGFVEKDSRLVLTNAHVVGMLDPKDMGPMAIELVVNSGGGDKQYALGGELLMVDKENDLAVIRPFIIEVGERHVVPDGLVVPRTSTVKELQKLFVFGFPLGDSLGGEISIRPTTVTSLRKNKIQVEGGMETSWASPSRGSKGRRSTSPSPVKWCSNSWQSKRSNKRASSLLADAE